MANTAIHNQIILRPPPGTRFSIFGADCVLQFERTKTKEVYEWLDNWLQTFVKPQVELEAIRQDNLKTAQLSLQIEKETDTEIDLVKHETVQPNQ